MSDKKTVIALGYFDSVHIGHRKVMQKARELAQKTNSNLAVFTFKGNLKEYLKCEDGKCVYTPCEREQLIKEIGVDEIFFAPVTKEFLSLDKREFLDFINKRYDIRCYVSGEDYRFGNKGLGDSDYLREYAKSKGQDYVVCQTENFQGEKISTTRIKKCLKDGSVKKAGQMLGRSYSVTGRVFEDRKIGRKLGFPTVNIAIDKDKFQLLGGVYKGSVYINGVKYSAIINYGARPTFDLQNKLVEAHVVDFNGDLYGKEITLYFEEFMRDIIKFDNENQLKEQLEIDLKNAKENNND